MPRLLKSGDIRGFDVEGGIVGQGSGTQERGKQAIPHTAHSRIVAGVILDRALRLRTIGITSGMN